MNKWNRCAIEIGRFINPKIVIHNTDYYAFRLPYFSKPCLLLCFHFAIENNFKTHPVRLDIWSFFILQVKLLTYFLWKKTKQKKPKNSKYHIYIFFCIFLAGVHFFSYFIYITEQIIRNNQQINIRMIAIMASALIKRDC